MCRLDDFTQQKNRQIGILYFDQYFCTSENLLIQIFWTRILKFSLRFSINAGLISDPVEPSVSSQVLSTEPLGSPLGLVVSDKIFFILPCISLCKTCDPRAGLFWPQRHNLNKFGRG